VDLLDSVRHRSTTATYDVATAETLGLNVIKEQQAWSPKLRRPQREPSAGSSRHAPPTIQELLQALFKVDRLGAMIGITIIGRWAWDLGDARYRNRFATGLRQLQEKDFILSARLRGKVATFALAEVAPLALNCPAHFSP
jgi:hypothetical protein